MPPAPRRSIHLPAAGAGLAAPVTTALARLISGELPLDNWVAIVRATVPPPARWRPGDAAMVLEAAA